MTEPIKKITEEEFNHCFDKMIKNGSHVVNGWRLAPSSLFLRQFNKFLELKLDGPIREHIPDFVYPIVTAYCLIIFNRGITRHDLFHMLNISLQFSNQTPIQNTNYLNFMKWIDYFLPDELLRLLND